MRYSNPKKYDISAIDYCKNFILQCVKNGQNKFFAQDFLEASRDIVKKYKTEINITETIENGQVKLESKEFRQGLLAMMAAGVVSNYTFTSAGLMEKSLNINFNEEAAKTILSTLNEKQMKCSIDVYNAYKKVLDKQKQELENDLDDNLKA